MKKLAIIHTTPVTVEPLKELARQVIGEIEIFNFVDDSILPQLAGNDGDLSAVEYRWMHYAQFAEQAGADVILSACSSVGQLADRADSRMSVPVLRIDEAMASEAVRRADRIGVAATLQTTLGPTMQLIREKAAQAGKEVELVPGLADRAYGKLMQGDREGHDEELAKTLMDLAGRTDVVVLAQASMARVVAKLPDAARSKFLSSPRSGMESVKKLLAGDGK
ncbi:aspartate/glutamate racemase family protein [Paenibacillus sepulcri]